MGAVRIGDNRPTDNVKQSAPFSALATAQTFPRLTKRVGVD